MVKNKDKRILNPCKIKEITNFNENNYINITTRNTFVFTLLNEALKDILLDFYLEINQDGIFLKEADSKKTHLVNLELYAKNFDFFYCHEPIIIGIDMGIFYKILKGASINDILSLVINKNDKTKLFIRIFNDLTKITKEYQITLKDINLIENINISNYDSKNVILNINTNKFKILCKELKNIHEYVNIIYNNSELIFETQNESLSCSGRQIINLEDASSDCYIIKNNNTDLIIQGIFKLKHLYQYTKFANLSQDMEINFSNERPLKISFKAGDLGKISLYTARCIVNDN